MPIWKWPNGSRQTRRTTIASGRSSGSTASRRQRNTRHQIEFPKTHDIKKLLLLVETASGEVAESLSDARWLTPFGVEIRYPSDTAEMLPGDEAKAIEIASHVRRVVLAILNAG